MAVMIPRTRSRNLALGVRIVTVLSVTLIFVIAASVPADRQTEEQLNKPGRYTNGPGPSMHLGPMALSASPSFLASARITNLLWYMNTKYI